MKTLKHPLLAVTAMLSTTLILGMILGGMLVGAIVRDRFETLRDIRTAEGFTRYVREQIGTIPADEEARFHSIINTAGADVEQLFKTGRADMMNIMDRMELELAPILSKEQLEHFQTERQKVRDQIDGN